ncbi:hypothetical protein GCM10007278_08990 [Paenalcaligenes hominis]|nr:hypothetical protein GCM10007278_08990 [Paenalcaligenes hominis]
MHLRAKVVSIGMGVSQLNEKICLVLGSNEAKTNTKLIKVVMIGAYLFGLL